MKNVLLVEDRPWRQVRLLGQEGVDGIRQLSGVAIPKEEECRDIIDRLNGGDTTYLSEYDLIIIHRSVLKTTGLKAVSGHCHSGNIDLMLFTGNQDQPSYTESDHPLLLLDSQQFYSKQLLPFLTKYIEGRVQHLFELLYGDNWNLTILLKYRLLRTRIDGEVDLDTRLSLEERLNELEESFDISSLNVDEEIARMITSS